MGGKKTECRQSERMNYNENEKRRDSHVEVLDGLLSIHHFARKWELRMAIREVDVHWNVHAGARAIVGGAGVADESSQGQGDEGKGEGSKRDDGGIPIGGAEQAHPEVAASPPGPLRFCDKSRGEKTWSAKGRRVVDS